jgi:hypothetical protein
MEMLQGKNSKCLKAFETIFCPFGIHIEAEMDNLDVYFYV